MRKSFSGPVLRYIAVFETPDLSKMTDCRVFFVTVFFVRFLEDACYLIVYEIGLKLVRVAVSFP